jgi:hypothetical protein
MALPCSWGFRGAGIADGDCATDREIAAGFLAASMADDLTMPVFRKLGVLEIKDLQHIA